MFRKINFNHVALNLLNGASLASFQILHVDEKFKKVQINLIVSLLVIVVTIFILVVLSVTSHHTRRSN